jgi:hypothetical protein
VYSPVFRHKSFLIENNHDKTCVIREKSLSLQRIPFGSAPKDTKKGRDLQILKIKNYGNEKTQPPQWR